MANRRGVLYITGALLIIGPPAFWLVSTIPVTPSTSSLTPVTLAADAAAPSGSALVSLAQRDPMALVRLGIERYDKTIRQYRCVLTKQERLGDELTEVQEIELRYRESPRSVYMIWKANADQARRALYLPEDSAYTSQNGEELARVEPAGAIARLFVKDIFMPIHGPDARKASRRAIDEAGFRATFRLLEAYNAVAAERGVLDLRYGGIGEIGGRPTYILLRDLPYTGPTGPYPDARMVLHLDQEWLLPVAVYSYADHAQKTLLGSYVFTQIEINPSFAPDAFAF
ncbi:MAG: DUF1571 domain-containing protein [Phycisphaerae bacterium]|nr:DUF1571 domain-containing protein [Phycisphaerae bacterium]